MASTADTPAWIALFLGLYMLAACVAELRAPGGWARLLDDFERSPALSFLTGAFTFTLGAAIYLASPWRPGDWLSIFISVIGGLAVAKGLFFLAAPDRVTALGRRVLTGDKTTFIAGLDAVLAAALIFVALSRLQTI
ncbi:hypothetical protein PF049_12790 [Erythrobacteraceae bacterium WH01K]|nr:hypothetical protein PF049_12790 [Erythrobacteraceae bacterium WH01K]